MAQEPIASGIDEDVRRRFESAWRHGARPQLASYLPSSDSPGYWATLEELIAIDMEFAWKSHGAASTAGSGCIAEPPPHLEDYIKIDPRLADQRVVVIRLIGEEIRIRAGCGERPDGSEYARRFPSFALECERLIRETPNRISPPVRRPPPDSSLGRFRLQAEQGRGGFGVVWRAQDDALGREVAVKQLTGPAAEDPSAQRRFLSEARIAAQLQHPGVVPIYEAGTQGPCAFYAMKLVSGRTLGDAIAAKLTDERSSERALEEAMLLAAFRSVVQTVAFSHSRNVVHRDLKPNNIVLGDYGETIVLDWGLAKRLDAGLGEVGRQEPQEGANDALPDATAPGLILGTPAYMSPEQALGKTAEVDKRSDVFSLGAILYHLLAGKRPFPGNTSAEVPKQVADATPIPLHTVCRNVPRALEAICRKSMEREPADRYPDGSALLGDLDRYFADEPVSAYREPHLSRLWRFLRRRRQTVTLAAAGLLLTIGVVVAGLWIRAEKRSRENETAARIEEARDAALRAERLAADRVLAGDFEAAGNTFFSAAISLDHWPTLTDHRLRLLNRYERANRLSEFYRLHEAIWRQNYHEYDDQVQESIPIALEFLGLTDADDQWDRLPVEDLTAQQRKQLEEDAHGLMLIQAVTLGKAVLSDFRGTAKKKEAKEGLAWCVRAQKKTRTQTIGLLEIVLKYSAGEMNALVVPLALRWMPTRSPQTTTDFHCMAVLHELLAQVREAKHHPKAKEAVGADLWSFLEFVQTMTDSGLDLTNPQMTSQRHFREVVRREQQRYWAYVFLGAGLSSQGDFMGAELAFNSCVTIRPESPEGYVGRAASLFRQGEKSSNEKNRNELQSRCRTDLERALRFGKHSGEIRFARADLLLRLPSEEVAGIEEMAAFVEEERPLRLLQGHWNLGAYQRKLEMVVEAAQLRRKNRPEAMGPQILALLALDQGKAAESLAQVAENAGLRSARVEAALGEKAMRDAAAKGKLDESLLSEAKRRFTNATVLDPKCWAARMGLARIAASESKSAGLAAIRSLTLDEADVSPWQFTEALLLQAQWAKETGNDSESQTCIRRVARTNLAAARKAAMNLGLERP
ncbi:MAG: protein kinase [Gemmataceae bacterium]